MTGMNDSFDATQFSPNQIGQAHPVGVYDAIISNTAKTQVKEKNGVQVQAGYLAVDFRTPAGNITMRYNLWPDPNADKAAKTVEIAHGQLSALCYAVGIFKVNFANHAAELRGGRCKIEVGAQADERYTEVKRVLDAQGNEPGKSSPPPQQGNGGAPNAQAWGVGGSAPVEAQNTAFAANTGPNPEQHQPQPGGWGNAQQPQTNQQPQGQQWGNQPQSQQPPANQGGWQPGPQQGNGPAAGGNPPWGGQQ